MQMTIGVPVYNGVAQIEECLTCLAEQTTSDLRILISDNASTDGTSEICAAFARKDERFVHLRRDETCDASSNFRSLLDLADTPLFMWRAHDDLSDPNFINRLASLFTDPDCRLAVGAVETRKQRSPTIVQTKRADVPAWLNTKDAPYDLRTAMLGTHQCWFYGLWHTDTLRDVLAHTLQDYPDIWGQDHLIVLNMVLSRAVRGHPHATFIQRIDQTKDPATVSAPGKVPLKVKRSRRSQARDAAQRAIERRALSAKDAATAHAALPAWLDRTIHSRTGMILGALGLRR